MFINPFKKKQPIQEPRMEQHLPPDLERFRSRSDDAPISPMQPFSRPYQPLEEEVSHMNPASPFDVPEKERKFRAFARELETPEAAGAAHMEERREKQWGSSQNRAMDPAEKLDMILDKLETIDLRLKVIEQKLERRPV